MKFKVVFLINFALLLIAGFVSAEDVLFEEDFLFSGRIEGAGTYFEIENSEYLNVILESSEEIEVVLESIPRMISLILEPATSETNPVILTLKNLEPNKTYYKYQDSYKNGTEILTDENGRYFWKQDLTQPRHIWFQETKSTVFLPEDCEDYGTWDPDSRTCTLNQDLSQGVEITEDNITLDCQGYKIIGSQTGYGIYLKNKADVIIKNCAITNFSYGIYQYYLSNNTIEQNQISNNWLGIILLRGSANKISNNIITHNIQDGLHVGSPSNLIENNNLSNNGRFGLTLWGSAVRQNQVIKNTINTNSLDGVHLEYASQNTITQNQINSNLRNGIRSWCSGNNTIYLNNLINNSPNYSQEGGTGCGALPNIFNSPEELNYKYNNQPFINYLGNHWNDYTGLDLNQDGIGELPYLSRDNYPLIKTIENYLILPLKLDPVIIIPGILGSWEKNGVWKIDPVFHTYDDLIDTLEMNGYVENETLFTMPYDWRNSNTRAAIDLRLKIVDVLRICECAKVDLVAHSMGGLIARQYIQSDDYRGDVDQLIFLGTPHLGAPKAYLAWEGGEFGPNSFFNNAFEEQLLKTSERKYDDLYEYVRNHPITSIQELLPIFNYLRDKLTLILREYPDNYPPNSFLDDLKSGSSVLSIRGIELTNITGLLPELSTIKAFIVVGPLEPPKWEHGYPDQFNDNPSAGIELGTGDGAVPQDSAEFISAYAEDSIRYEAEHAALPKTAQGKIYEILTGKTLTDEQLSDKIGFIDNRLKPGLKLLLVRIFSPVDIQLIDPVGRRVGKDFVIEEEVNEIPLAFYSGFLTDKEYIAIVEPSDGNYKIVTEGLGDGGEYIIAVGYITGDEMVDRTFMSHTLPSIQEEITLTVSSTGDEPIILEDTTQITYDVIIRHIQQMYLMGWINDLDYKEELIQMIKNVEKVENKNPTARDKLIEVFLKKLDIGLKEDKINLVGHNLLVEDISNI